MPAGTGATRKQAAGAAVAADQRRNLGEFGQAEAHAQHAKKAADEADALAAAVREQRRLHRRMQARCLAARQEADRQADLKWTQHIEAHNVSLLEQPRVQKNISDTDTQRLLQAEQSRVAVPKVEADKRTRDELQRCEQE